MAFDIGFVLGRHLRFSTLAKLGANVVIGVSLLWAILEWLAGWPRRGAA